MRPMPECPVAYYWKGWVGSARGDRWRGPVSDWRTIWNLWEHAERHPEYYGENRLHLRPADEPTQLEMRIA